MRDARRRRDHAGAESLQAQAAPYKPAVNLNRAYHKGSTINLNAGPIEIRTPASNRPSLRISDFYNGTSLEWFADNRSSRQAAIEPDFSGAGAFFYAARDDNSAGWIIDGNYQGTLSPHLALAQHQPDRRPVGRSSHGRDQRGGAV